MGAKSLMYSFNLICLGFCLAASGFFPFVAFSQSAKIKKAVSPHPHLVAPPKSPKTITLLNSEDNCSDSVNPLLYKNKHGVLNGYYRILYSIDRQPDDVLDKSPYYFEEGVLNKGLKQGVWKTEFLLTADGLPYSETYKNGLLNGEFIVFNRNKTIRYRTAFRKGTGIWKSFYPSGKIKTVYSLVDGQLQGARIEYSPDGAIKSEMVYDHGAVRSNKTY
ncbi:hypothetical protein GCM10022409_23340 [Hymenobacter glaciei]|uniref:Uncharacterized protein n=1 Tax=Hymenobacter glaciei TaxID=877209 RepID=A0ABP7U7W6_9BACT